MIGSTGMWNSLPGVYISSVLYLEFHSETGEIADEKHKERKLFNSVPIS